MVEPQLGAVVRVALLLQQQPRSCEVQLAVVQDDQARESEEVGPHVVMTGGVAQLVDGQVVGVPLMLPDEVMRIEDLDT